MCRECLKCAYLGRRSWSERRKRALFAGGSNGIYSTQDSPGTSHHSLAEFLSQEPLSRPELAAFEEFTAWVFLLALLVDFTMWLWLNKAY